VLGKNQHSDSDKNKPTYPAIIGLEESKKAYKKIYIQASNQLQLLSVNANELQLLIKKLQTRLF
jgi:geranylgeranyl pyrophosphate synthase